MKDGDEEYQPPADAEAEMAQGQNDEALDGAEGHSVPEQFPGTGGGSSQDGKFASKAVSLEANRVSALSRPWRHR